MKSDVNGCSQCPAGSESYDKFRNRATKRTYFQYDFRTTSGLLFSCVAPTLAACREKRDLWLLEVQS